MPIETSDAITWALQQTAIYDDTQFQVTKNTTQALVDKVREYFNTNNIAYKTFSYDDLVLFFN